MAADERGNGGILAQFERSVKKGRGGINGSKLQEEFSTGLCLKVHRPCGGETHVHTRSHIP